MKKLILIAVILSLGLIAIPSLFPVLATDTTGTSISNQIQGFGNTVYGQDAPAHPAAIAANIIRIILGLLGIVFVILVIYGGFLYMSSAGEGEKVKKAKNVIVYAAIGVVIIVLAYAITTFIVGAILSSAGGAGGGMGGGSQI